MRVQPVDGTPTTDVSVARAGHLRSSRRLLLGMKVIFFSGISLDMQALRLTFRQSGCFRSKLKFKVLTRFLMVIRMELLISFASTAQYD
jgi:hypothetical protein